MTLLVSQQGFQLGVGMGTDLSGRAKDGDRIDDAEVAV